MFDANMRHLPKGKKFFCKVWYYDNNDHGIKKGDFLLCTMLDDSAYNPRVKIKLNDKYIIISDGADYFDKLFVYEGNVDGTGFIDDKSKVACMKLLEEC